MKTNTTDLIPAINQSLEIELPVTISQDEMRQQLATHINHLINQDFEKLVFSLYRIDVDEARMRALLAKKDGENAAFLISDLIIERQLQKIESRKKYRQNNPVNEKDSW